MQCGTLLRHNPHEEVTTKLSVLKAGIEEASDQQQYVSPVVLLLLHHIYDLTEAVEDLQERTDQMEASQSASQQDITNLTDELNSVASGLSQVSSDLNASQAQLQTEIDSLASQGVNVSGLKAVADTLAPAVSTIDSHVQTLGGLTPTPAPGPEPTPSPGPEPGPTPGP